MEYFEFIETPVFSKQRETLLDDDSFRELQTHLLKKNHAEGDTISKTVGCQKMRWNRLVWGSEAASESSITLLLLAVNFTY